MADKPLIRAGEYGVKPTGMPDPATALPLPPSGEAPPTEASTPQLDPNRPADRLAMELVNQGGIGVAEALKKANDWLALTPAERWEKNISDAKLTPEEAEQILTTVLEKGYWEKTYTLYRGKLKVVLRSRDFSANQRVAAARDDLRTNDRLVMQQTTLRVQLACSLVSFNGKEQPFARADATRADHADAYNARLQFCDQVIQGPVTDAVYRCLQDFDQKTYAALSEGADDGF